MQLIKSPHAGFCFGVKRAMQIITETTQSNVKKPIYMLGSLVHNENVVQKITQQGIILVNNINDIPDQATVILSAHGSPPSIYQKAQTKNLHVIDATCPYVTAVHNLGKLLATENYHIVIVGDQNHAEVQGILGTIHSLTQNVHIVSRVDDIRKNNLEKLPKVGIVSQTTQDTDIFKQIVNHFIDTTTDLRIFNTICQATRCRQSAAIQLASQVDLMIVVGSRTSANTKRLAEICQPIVNTYQVETARDLDSQWFINIKKVGLTAGASTPDWVIDEVEKLITNQNTPVHKNTTSVE
ncbi:MAG: 4-hydroxy-3-methylbut-2-enyl diphosphate reductase [Patescibacteria group bacterium]